MFDVLHSILTFAIIGLSAFGLGRPLVKRLKVVDHDALSVGVWSLSLGLLAAALIFRVLSLAGGLAWPAVAAVSFAASFWGLTELLCAYLIRGQPRLIPIGPRPEPTEPPGNAPPALRAAIVLAAVVLGASYVAALAPPTSPEVLARSLEIPKSVLLSRPADRAWPRVVDAPNVVQMWYVWSLALDGPVAANLVHWGLGVLLAMACALLARPLLGARSSLAAAVIVVLCPGIQHQMCAVPLDDLALALFTTLALAAAWQILGQLESLAWSIPGGAMLGGAVAVKPCGLLFAVALAAVWLACVWQQRDSRRRLSRAGLLMTIAAVVTAIPWLSAVWLAASFGPHQSAESVLAHLGPVLLLAPAGLIVSRRLRGLNLLLGVLVLYTVLAALVPLPGRWWAPLVPPATVLAVWGWKEMRRLPPRPRWVAYGMAATLALVVPRACFQRAASSWAVATGLQSRAAYLSAHEPTYRAASLLNRIRRPEDRLLCQGASAFYFACATDCLSDALEQPLSDGPADSHHELLRRAQADGFSYVLVTQTVDDASVPPADSPDAGLPDGLLPAAGNEPPLIGEVIPILEYRFADDYSRPVRYRLLRIR